MVSVKLSLNKDLHENANAYFEKAKKLKAKLPGVEETLTRTQEELETFEERKNAYLQRKEKEQKIRQYRKKTWYEKFRHTWTSEGFLFVIGKDAGTNEILVRKHAEEQDIIIHSEAPGSPFGILKNARDKISKEGIEEAAQFLLCFSKQWKAGFGTADAFWGYPEQFTKKAPSGEYIGKGSFMIYGEKNQIRNIPLRICLGVFTEKLQTEEEQISMERLFAGSEEACRTFCGNRFVRIEPGKDKYKAVTKELKKRLKTTIEDLPHYIPNGIKVMKK